jgi:hypothetical protein
MAYFYFDFGTYESTLALSHHFPSHPTFFLLGKRMV